MQTPPTNRLETALARNFQLCDANRAALLKAREDQKLSTNRYWWQDNDNETTKTR
jgi:hypothetical protein